MEDEPLRCVGTLHFYDEDNLKRAVHATDLDLCLSEICRELRTIWKHGEEGATVADFYDDRLFGIIHSYGLTRDQLGF